jgi:hypothetical protein
VRSKGGVLRIQAAAFTGRYGLDHCSTAIVTATLRRASIGPCGTSAPWALWSLAIGASLVVGAVVAARTSLPSGSAHRGKCRGVAQPGGTAARKRCVAGSNPRRLHESNPLVSSLPTSRKARCTRPTTVEVEDREEGWSAPAREASLVNLFVYVQGALPADMNRGPASRLRRSPRRPAG